MAALRLTDAVVYVTKKGVEIRSSAAIQRSILKAIAERCNRQGRIRATIPDIMSWTATTLGAVRNALVALQKARRLSAKGTRGRGARLWTFALPGPSGFVRDHEATMPRTRDNRYIHARKVLRALDDLAKDKNRVDKDGWLEASKEKEIAPEAGVSAWQVSSSLDYLVNCGTLERQSGQGKGRTGENVTSRYRRSSWTETPRRRGGRRPLPVNIKHADERAAATMKFADWLKARDDVGVPITSTKYAKYGSWVNAGEHGTYREIHDLRVVKSQKTRAFKQRNAVP